MNFSHDTTALYIHWSFSFHFLLFDAIITFHDDEHDLHFIGTTRLVVDSKNGSVELLYWVELIRFYIIAALWRICQSHNFYSLYLDGSKLLRFFFFHAWRWEDTKSTATMALLLFHS